VSLKNRRRSVPWLPFVVVFAGLLAFYQLPSSAQQKSNQQSPQEQSVGRDQAYVRQLLQRGTPDAKVETLLQLTSRFSTFNPSGDFHAYSLASSPKKKPL